MNGGLPAFSTQVYEGNLKGSNRGKAHDWLTFNARVAGGLELLPISRFKGQTVRIYSVKDGDREAAYFEANRLMKTGARFEGLFGWNYFFRILRR